MGINPGDVNDGFVKIVVDKDTNYILGMHVTGPQASILFQPYVNLMNSGVTPLTAINEEIASERTKRLREKGITRKMDPKSVITVGETMSPHPSLVEVIMWTQAYYETPLAITIKPKKSQRHMPLALLFDYQSID